MKATWSWSSDGFHYVVVWVPCVHMAWWILASSAIILSSRLSADLKALCVHVYLPAQGRDFILFFNVGKQNILILQPLYLHFAGLPGKH